jgi:hypothetical protein
MEAQTVLQQPSRAREERSAVGAPAPPARWRPSPLLIASAVCIALAAVSTALLPSVPSYDPWAWLVWGREIVDPHLRFAVAGGPSWKPLPVMFTAIFALFGGAAPTLWMIVARAGGVLGLVAGYRLARRLAGGGCWGAVAGALAAAGIVLTQQWGYYMFRGTSEALLIGLSLWAVDRHLVGRSGSAFVLGVLTGLIRPEAWPLIGIYAVWLSIHEPRLRLLVITGLASIPLVWLVPPWIDSGQPLLAAIHAHEYNGHLGPSPFLEVLRRGANVQVAPALACGIAAVALGLSDRLTQWFAALTVSWWVIVVAMTLGGFPGLERFYLPAAAMTCVLGGVGVVRLARFVGDAFRQRALRPPATESVHRFGRKSLQVFAPLQRRLRGGWAQGAVALVLLGAAAPFTVTRVSALWAQEPIAARAVTRLDQLGAAVAAVGGRRGVYPCHSSFAAVNHTVQTALAWTLQVTFGRVGTTMRHQGLLFVGPHDPIDGRLAPVDPRLAQRQLIARAGAWRVYRMTSPGASTRCVGR